MEGNRNYEADISIVRYKEASEESLMLGCAAEDGTDISLQYVDVSGRERYTALNDGIKKAGGRWILIQDEGDSRDSLMLSSMLGTVSLQETELCICGMLMEGPFGRCERLCSATELNADRESFINAVFSELLKKQLLSFTGNKLFKSSVLLGMDRLFREDMLENTELEFCLRYMNCCDSLSLIRGAHLRKAAPRPEVPDPEAFSYLLGAYNELFDSLDIDDDVINEVNDHMLSILMASLKKTYQAFDLSEEEKLSIMEACVKRSDVQELLMQTAPEGINNRTFKFLARNKSLKLLHRLLMKERPRQEISMGKRNVKKPLKEGCVKAEEQAPVSESPAEKPSEGALNDKAGRIPQREELPQLSDAELDEIRDQLEAGLRDL